MKIVKSLEGFDTFVAAPHRPLPEYNVGPFADDPMDAPGPVAARRAELREVSPSEIDHD